MDMNSGAIEKTHLRVRSLRRLYLSNGLISLLLVISGQAQADAEDARSASKMWSAFKCSVYAELSGDASNQQRMFVLGYEAGKKFLSALSEGSITEEEAKSNVPTVVLLMLGGPSADFMIGRFYEAAMNDAFDEVVKEDEKGFELPVEDWRNDELKELRARILYSKSNCHAL